MKKRKPISQKTKNKISLSKIGRGRDKQYQKKCTFCQKEYLAYHNRGKFCSIKCMDKNRYHNGLHGIKERERLNKERKFRYTNIGQCGLCGIRYMEIKTMRDLGSTMYNAASVFHKDHIIPIARGGSNSSENIRYLCWFCNMTRKDIDAKYDNAISLAAVAFWGKLKDIYT